MDKKKEKIIGIVTFVIVMIIEIFLLFGGASIWGRDKAYHIWGNANTFLLIAFAIYAVIASRFRKNKKDDDTE